MSSHTLFLANLVLLVTRLFELPATEQLTHRSREDWLDVAAIIPQNDWIQFSPQVDPALPPSLCSSQTQVRGMRMRKALWKQRLEWFCAVFWTCLKGQC